METINEQYEKAYKLIEEQRLKRLPVKPVKRNFINMIIYLLKYSKIQKEYERNIKKLNKNYIRAIK